MRFAGSRERYKSRTRSGRVDFPAARQSQTSGGAREENVLGMEFRSGVTIMSQLLGSSLKARLTPTVANPTVDIETYGCKRSVRFELMSASWRAGYNGV